MREQCERESPRTKAGIILSSLLGVIIHSESVTGSPESVLAKSSS